MMRLAPPSVRPEVFVLCHPRNGVVGVHSSLGDAESQARDDVATFRRLRIEAWDAHGRGMVDRYLYDREAGYWRSSKK